MEVILKEDVAKLGSRGDVVKVAEGYGRNYLLPRKLAIQANDSNKAVIAQMKAAAVRRSAKEKAQAEELAKQFDGVSVSFQRKSGEHDQLFGSVTSSDLADALTKKGFNVDRRKIQLHEPLKTVGEFTVPVKLHKDVTAHLKVVIEKEPAEAYSAPLLSQRRCLQRLCRSRHSCRSSTSHDSIARVVSSLCSGA